jgi:hypothetical protein
MRGIRCECGGWIEMGTEPLYGRSVETCSGPCGYTGSLRTPVLVAPVALSEKLCIEGCGRRTYTPNALRCRECAEAKIVRGRAAATRAHDERKRLMRRAS